MKNVYYITYTRFPSEKAHALYVAKYCESLARQDVPAEVIAPRRFGVADERPADYFGLTTPCRVTCLPTIDLFPVPFLKKLAARVGMLTFLFSLRCFMRKLPKDATLITNDAPVASLLGKRFAHVVWEVHDFPEQRLGMYTKAAQRASRIMTNNRWKVDKLAKQLGIPKEKIFYEHNGVDLKRFESELSKTDARKQLGLDSTEKIAVYTGHLFGWKGSATLAEAAHHMPDVAVYFIGGTQKDVQQARGTYKDVQNAHFIGHRPHAEIPLWQTAADALVLPNTGKENISRFYTSPMKVFEYMAAKRPIVASDIPSIREVLNEENAILVEPDDPTALTESIKRVSADPKIYEDRVEQAYKDIQYYTWDARAERIIQALTLHT